MEVFSILLIILFSVVAFIGHLAMAALAKSVVSAEDWWDKKYNKYLLLPLVPELFFIIILIVVCFVFTAAIISDLLEE